MKSRDELWLEVFKRLPVENVLGFSNDADPDDLEIFIQRALHELSDAEREPEQELIKDIVSFVKRLNRWPGRAFNDCLSRLIRICVTPHQEQKSRWAERTLELLLLALNPAYVKYPTLTKTKGAILSNQQRRLVQSVMKAVWRDKEYLTFGEPPQAVNLAVMLASNFTAIFYEHQRTELIDMLEGFVELFPQHYTHPFIADLLLVYRRMGLDKHALQTRRW
ncbi:MAG: hypothetical protein MI923_15320 [Phycisphaerales bacterium]|nr:hypothetical protein [Phycisphaerales bacterium]